MSDYPDELYWDAPHRNLRGSTAAEMDEELRQHAADPWGLLRTNVRLRSNGSPAGEDTAGDHSSNMIEDYAVGHTEEIEPEDRKFLGKLFRKHRERLHKEAQ
jgi:hypothetical protein